MQTNNRRLVDEALEYEAVKNTFLLGWEWIALNKSFTAMALGIYVIFNIFGVSFLATIFAIMIHIYMGRIFYTSNNIGMYVDAIKTSDTEKLLKGTFPPALGAYLGWTLLMLILGFMVLLFVSSMHDLSTLNVQTAEDIEANIETLKPLLLAFAMPFSFLMLILLYIKPLVESNITVSKTFKEGFLAVFSTFSFALWRKSLRRDYFFYVLQLDVLLLIILLPIGFLVSLLGLNMVTYILVFIGLYLVNIFMAIASMMLRRMVIE